MASKSFIKNKIKSSIKSKSFEIVEVKLEEEKIYFQPIVTKSKSKVINDFFTRKTEKAKIIYKSEDIYLPNLYEAIQGKIKIEPIWKKEANT